jgi:hypothetical protein
MRKFTNFILITAAILLLFTAVSARAQTTTTTPTIPGLTSTFATWLSSYDTNLTFQDVIVWDGFIYQDGVNTGNELGISVDLWKSKPLKNEGKLFTGLECRFRQASIAGLNLSEGIGAEFGWTKFDLRVGVFGDYVYLHDPEAVGRPANRHSTAEFGIFADKMLSSSSAVGIFISQQLEQNSQVVGANLNVSFGNGSGLFGLF